MTRISRVDDKEECSADKQYYECSYFDFKYIGCCSHDPCIKPRGCRDDPVTSDPSSRPTSDTSDIETIVRENTATQGGDMISIPPFFSRGGFPIETTLETRIRSSYSLTMSDDKESSSPTERAAPPTTMTDSGTTRTVSNSHRVTITNKKTIYTSAGPSTPTGFLTSVTSADTDELPFSTGSFKGTSVSLPVETNTPGTSLGDNKNDRGSPSIGLVVGAVAGGIAFLALIVVAVVCIRRRRAKNIEFPNTPYYLEEKGEKSYLSRILSRKSTRRSQDPFAPFGGRIDRVDNHHQPPSGTFEMDGADNVVHELPDVAFDYGYEKESQPRSNATANSTGHTAVSGYSAQTAYPTATGSCIDPRANLNATLEDRQQKQFVNHWNQYRALGESANQRQQG
ncbi:fatty-acid amide hydrolase [Fusarium longipes]|uniref:Fatty-acid amide hydrolase n=1 Tax=Fusarium longipes TaxID=694270 RepID=A0A395T4F8_9HYPO|nr:fatty-acid amide hydrolase [Fusarium longipes]